MPSRKPVKPLKEPTAAEATGRTNALLENLHGEFKTFGEGISTVRARVERMEPTLNALFAEFQTFKMAVHELAGDMREIKKDVKDVKNRLTAVEAR